MPDRIEDYLGEFWVEHFAAAGIVALERLLERHARFSAYLEETGRS